MASMQQPTTVKLCIIGVPRYTLVNTFSSADDLRQQCVSAGLVPQNHLLMVLADGMLRELRDTDIQICRLTAAMSAPSEQSEQCLKVFTLQDYMAKEAMKHSAARHAICQGFRNISLGSSDAEDSQPLMPNKSLREVALYE